MRKTYLIVLTLLLILFIRVLRKFFNNVFLLFRSRATAILMISHRV